MTEHSPGIFKATARDASLGNEIDAAIKRAIADGVDPDIVCSVAINVAADNWIAAYRDPVTALVPILEGKEAKRRGGGIG